MRLLIESSKCPAKLSILHTMLLLVMLADNNLLSISSHLLWSTIWMPAKYFTSVNHGIFEVIVPHFFRDLVADLFFSLSGFWMQSTLICWSRLEGSVNLKSDMNPFSFRMKVQQAHIMRSKFVPVRYHENHAAASICTRFLKNGRKLCHYLTTRLKQLVWPLDKRNKVHRTTVKATIFLQMYLLYSVKSLEHSLFHLFVRCCAAAANKNDDRPTRGWLLFSESALCHFTYVVLTRVSNWEKGKGKGKGRGLFLYLFFFCRGRKARVT